MNRNQTIRLVGLSSVTFLVGFVFINWFLSSGDIDHIPASQLWIPAYVMGGVTLICTVFMPSRPIILAPIAIGSILVGVAFDALTDRTMDRNLFPIEMVIWGGISTPGIFAGNLTGCLLYWIKKKLHNQASHATSEPARGAASSAHEG